MRGGLSLWRAMGAVALGLLARLAVAEQSGPSTKPLLRIEAGMHTAMIKRIDVDRARERLVTASDDKTARIWDLKTGRLLSVLRPPIGDGHEGKRGAAAFSADGTTVLCRVLEATGGHRRDGSATGAECAECCTHHRSTH